MAGRRSDVMRRGSPPEGLVDKKPGYPDRPPFCTVAVLPTPKCGVAAFMLLMAPCAPYNLCRPHIAPDRHRSCTPSLCCGGWR